MIYKDNIMSPDDYTKLIFNVNYEKAINDDFKTIVNDRIDALNEKYQIEDKADKIIEETLELGECYYAVLSLEDELSMMLSDPIRGNTLNEQSLRTLDPNSVDMPILKENIEVNAESAEALSESLDVKLSEAQA
jgi:uncharacterized secreted protein with C-terminal beta-propeller domain